MLLVDARGIPLSIIVTAANRNDITQLVPTLDAVVVPRPPVAPRARQHLCADAGFVGAVARQEMMARDYTPHVRPRGEERTERRDDFAIAATVSCRNEDFRFESQFPRHQPTRHVQLIAPIGFRGLGFLHGVLQKNAGGAAAVLEVTAKRRDPALSRQF
jgi:hypothetical protein